MSDAKDEYTEEEVADLFDWLEGLTLEEVSVLRRLYDEIKEKELN